ARYRRSILDRSASKEGPKRCPMLPLKNDTLRFTNMLRSPSPLDLPRCGRSILDSCASKEGPKPCPMLLLKNDTLRFTDTLKYPSLLRLLGLATIYFGQQCPEGGAKACCCVIVVQN